MQKPIAMFRAGESVAAVLPVASLLGDLRGGWVQLGWASRRTGVAQGKLGPGTGVCRHQILVSCL